MRKPLYLALLALLGGNAAMAAADTVLVRLDHASRSALETLAITPLNSTGYGSFQVLELSAADAQKLVARTPGASVLADAGRIRFNQVDFDPLRQPARIGNGQFPITAAGEGLHLVQFDAPIKQEWRDALEARGLRVLQYYPGEAFLVWGRVQAAAETTAQAHVRWQGGFLADYKINPDLAGRSGRINNVTIHFYNDGNVDNVISELHKLGANVLTHGPAQADKTFFDVWIQVDAARLADIARLPQVIAVAYASPYIEYEDEMAAQIVAGNYNASSQPLVGYAPWLVTYGFDGSGVTWAISDTGVDLTHPDLQPRLTAGFSFPGCVGLNGDDSSGGGHGTHVAGIIGGMAIGDGAGAAVDEDDAAGFRYGQGLATGASIYPMCDGSGSQWPPTGGWQALSKQSLTGNAIGMNASWTTGEGIAHGYQASERTFDTMIRDGNFDVAGNQPFMIAFSAGNSGSGPSTLTAPKEAKNPIITAASVNGRAGSINNIAGFSSRGPAVDGRVLPTIAAPGDTIASTKRRAGASQCGTSIAGTNNHYSNCSGTSMAAPQVSGALTVLAQWWRANNAGATFSPAMAKALLVNGAVDMATGDVPNNNEGWGRIHIPRSTGAGNQRHTVDQTVILGNAGDTHQVQFGIADSAKPLRITLAWTDAPGAVGANPALVNNLDLEVTNAGNTYRGNVMTAGVSTTGGTADARNNVENVFLPAGSSGSATLTVRATTLPGDGIPGNADTTDQDFALICDNCALVPNYGLSPAQRSREICAPNAASYSVMVDSILGYSQTVNLSTSNVPSGATASVLPTSVAPGNAVAVTVNPGSAAAGSYTINLDATSTSGAQTLPLDLLLATQTPAVPALATPADNATNVATTPTLTWAASAQTKTYTVEVSTDPSFSSIAFTQDVTGTSVTIAPPLATNTRYYWRTRAANICGTSANAPVFTFRTAAAPGDCADGLSPNTVFISDVEGPTTGWATTGSTGSSTWAVSTARPNSPTKSWLATDITTTSDQRLISPSITLPSGQSPLTLSFMNDVNMEERSAGGCWDGGFVEISTNDGSTWTQVTGAQLLTTPYTGALNDGPGNGLQAWCGTLPYRKTVVNLDSYAGQNVRVRFRASTDGSQGDTPLGWFVDDIKVQGCRVLTDAIFADGFEAAAH